MKYKCSECEVKCRKSKKELFRCSECRKDLCARHTFSRPDESNIAITKNAPDLCKECYLIKYK